jgi:hypothetical protein
MILFNSKKEAESYLRCISQIKLKDQIEIYTADEFTNKKTATTAIVQVAAICPIKKPEEHGVEIESHYPHHQERGFDYVRLRCQRIFLTSTSSVLAYTIEDFDGRHGDVIYQAMQAMGLPRREINLRYFKTLNNSIRVAKIIKAE